MQSQRTRVKICGLTRCQDVEAAACAGADALGFVCYEGSPRYVDGVRLAELARALPPLVVPVLLFVNAAPEQVWRALEAMPAALLQFHGDEDHATCRAFGRPYLRALALAGGDDLVDWERRFPSAAGVLVDAPRQPARRGGAPVGQHGTAQGLVDERAHGPVHDPAARLDPVPVVEYGGTGRTANWSRLPGPSLRSLPLVLAGGLQADNVAAAIAAVRPYAVDVSSGVEETRGIKSADRMRAFIAAVRRADDESGAP